MKPNGVGHHVAARTLEVGLNRVFVHRPLHEGKLHAGP
jgi:hypothetical protein